MNWEKTRGDIPQHEALKCVCVCVHAVLPLKFARESWGNQFLGALTLFLATPQCGLMLCHLFCEAGRLAGFEEKAVPSDLNFTSFTAVA